MGVPYRSAKYMEEIVNTTSIGSDNHFGEENLKILDKVTKSFYEDLCYVYGANGIKELNPEVLNRPSVVKAQMAELLDAAIQLIDYCYLPLLSEARCKIECLQEEKIEDQKEIIRLQKELVSQKNEELGLVSKTVESEMKSYSSVLQKSCSTALSPRNIATAVKSVKKEEDRSKELIVFGVAEKEGECIDTKITQILDQLEEKPRVSDCKRIGLRTADKVRPIRFSVRSVDIVQQILRKAKRLKGIDGYKSVYISPNRTLEERISRQKLVSELKEKRANDPDSNYFIRRGEVVKGD